MEVDEIVRIRVGDYPNIALPGDVYSHFNLPLIHDRTGFSIVLSAIIEPGYFIPGGEEKQPLLSFQNVWKADVVEFVPHLTYDEIQKEHLVNCIGGANSADSLKMFMARRYKESLPMLTHEEIIAQGFSYTKIKLKNRITYN